MTRPVLGELELMETAYSGFSFPARAQVVGLIAAAADAGGNAVVQSTALTLRQATISWHAPSTVERDTANAYHEDLEVVEFTDREGVVRQVQVIAFSGSVRVVDRWECSATLLEIAIVEPEP